jgi:peptide deformylase
LYARAICHEVDHLNGVLIHGHVIAAYEKKARLDGEQKALRHREKQKNRAKSKVARKSRKRNRV